MKPIFGLIVGLFLMGIILLTCGILVGNTFTVIKTAANSTDTYDEVEPIITDLGKVFTITGGIFMLAPFTLFIVQVLYAKGYIGGYGGGPYQPY